MKVLKGQTCVTTCCKPSRTYKAEFDFEPTETPLVLDGVVFLRGTCFLCLLRTEIEPELRKHGIVMTHQGS